MSSASQPLADPSALQWQDWQTAPAALLEAIDSGLHSANLAAAPLDEVQALACSVHDAAGRLLGGALGRSWGQCAELQQLWVCAEQRRQGLGSALLMRFEALAAQRGCTQVYLETFSFQAPGLYLRHGYREVSALRGFPQGIVKYLLQRSLDPA